MLNDRPPKKKEKIRSCCIPYTWILVRAWSGLKTGSSVRSIGQQYTKNGEPGRQQKQQQQQQPAAAPATVPREYYTASSALPPFSRPLFAPSCSGNPRFPTRTPPHRTPNALRLVSTVGLLSSPATSHPTGSRALSLPRFSSAPPLASSRPYHVPRPPLRRRRGGSYVPWVGGARGRNMCNAQP